jgi:hypothetical protein
VEPLERPGGVEAGLDAAGDWVGRFISPRELGALDMPVREAAVSWERAEGRLTLRVEVPVGASATVYLPVAGGPVPAPLRVGHGHHAWQVADPLTEPPPAGS